MVDPHAATPSLRFHYLKSSEFRSIHVDGAVGGIHPSGRGLHLAMFVERIPVPQQTDYEVNPDGMLGAEIEGSRVAREGIVRELQIDAFMDRTTAGMLHDLLGTLLKRLKELDQ